MSALVDRPDAAASRDAPAEIAPRRDQLLEAALFVISRKGFQETSMSDIARRAGVSRATVYLHFRDRRDILVALADRIALRIIDAVSGWPVLPSPADAPAGDLRAEADMVRAMIHARIARILDTIFQNADAARLVLRVTRGSDSLVEDTLRRIDDHVVTILAREIEVAVGFGWARPCEPIMMARFILGGIERLSIGALDRDEPLDVEAVAREVTAFVSAGLVNAAHFRPEEPARDEPAAD